MGGALISVQKIRKYIPPPTPRQTTRTTDQSEKLPLYTAGSPFVPHPRRETTPVRSNMEKSDLVT
jgi:hypothetical protein